jgi:hypothetical protein
MADLGPGGDNGQTTFATVKRRNLAHAKCEVCGAAHPTMYNDFTLGRSELLCKRCRRFSPSTRSLLARLNAAIESARRVLAR